jgi:hypothetical protein
MADEQVMSAGKETAALGPLERLKVLGRYIRDFANPRYHIRKIVEDFRAAKHALRNRDLDTLSHNEVEFAHALRGRLFACFMLAGAPAGLGPIIGTFVQYQTGKPTLALWVGIISANILNTVSFQVVWWFAHRKMYARTAPTAIGRFKSFEHDILRLQWDGFRLALIIIAVTGPVATAVIELLNHFAPQVSKVVPFPLLTSWTEILLLQSSLVRLMGDLFERHSHRLAQNHLTPVPEASV